MGRLDRRRDRERALVRAPHRARQAAGDPHARAAHGFGHSPPLVRLRARPTRSSRCCRSTRAGRTRCSRRCGGCRAARRTSSRSSSPSSSSARRSLSAAARTSFRLKLRLMSEPGVVVTDVTAVRGPLGRGAAARAPRLPRAARERPRRRRCARPTTRGRSEIEDTRAVSFAFYRRGGRRLRARLEPRRASRCRST